VASILVIDDDRAVLGTLKILLEQDSHTVETANDGRAGLRLLEIQTFNLLIVDIFMPGMDGFETMRLVHRSWPEMPIIVISGQQFRPVSEGGPDFLYMATKLGAVSSLQKPFKPRDLLTAVAKSLSESAATRPKIPPD
jgi:DNA-binding NtrC family response regulator